MIEKEDKKVDWSIINSLNDKKEYVDVDNPSSPKYQPFLINRLLSGFIDTVLQANEMNIYHDLDNKLQYDYLYRTIKPKRRISKKKQKVIPDNFDEVQEFYEYNNKRTLEALSILTENNIKEIKRRLDKGGVK